MKKEAILLCSPSLIIKAKSSPWPPSPGMIWSPPCSLSSPLFPHSPTPYPTDLLTAPSSSQAPPCSKPLHWLSLSPGTLFPMYLHDSFSDNLQVFVKMSLPQRSPSKPPYIVINKIIFFFYIIYKIIKKTLFGLAIHIWGWGRGPLPWWLRG